MKPVIENPAARVLAIVKERGIARARDLAEAGIPLVYLKRLCDAGELIKLGRGLYQLPETVGTDAAHTLAEAARLMPKGVVCLLSALRYHGLTTQLPRATWITLPHKTAKSRTAQFPVEIVYAGEPAFSFHVEHVFVEGVSVPIYGVAKTIADCFKYRRRVGLDVAIEALRDGLQQRKTSVDGLMEAAAIDRVTKVIRPYVEALA